MNIYILTIKIKCSLKWNGTIKEKRQAAQKIKQVYKNKFNVSIKLVYLDDSRSFLLYMALLGESKDYLLDLMNSIEELLDQSDQVDSMLEYNIDMW